jgi:glucuronate isomerase
MSKLALHPDRLFPADPGTRLIARSLYREVATLPILSPHGHTDPAWFAGNAPFTDATSLLLVPDHYLLRMLHSQGVPLASLGVPTRDGTPFEQDPRRIWRAFARHYHLFRGTPSRLWLDWAFAEVFRIEVRLTPDSADHYFDVISAKLKQDDFRPLCPL